jgi:4,5-DOPA dioxygenase extradiol
MDDIYQFLKRFDVPVSDAKSTPLMFVGHGNPMNAIQDNEFSRAWKKIGQQLPSVRAIIIISAHWQTKGTWITAMEKPKTIHDFYGFPKEMYEQQYPAPGSPELATEIFSSKNEEISLDQSWGLDHGAWSVLKPMFPEANIPVLQLSLDSTKSPVYHFRLAKILKEYRNKGVLIIGSGNIVHNLSMIQFSSTAYDWAIEFDHQVKSIIDSRNLNSLIEYEKLGNPARLSVPTNEHYLPMLYALSLVEAEEEIQYFNEITTMGSVSMRSFIAG